MPNVPSINIPNPAGDLFRKARKMHEDSPSTRISIRFRMTTTQRPNLVVSASDGELDFAPFGEAPESFSGQGRRLFNDRDWSKGQPETPDLYIEQTGHSALTLKMITTQYNNELTTVHLEVDLATSVFVGESRGMYFTLALSDPVSTPIK